MDLSNWLKQEKLKKYTYPLSSQPYKAPIQETKPAVFNRPSADTTKTGDINWGKVLGENKPLTNEKIKN